MVDYDDYTNLRILEKSPVNTLWVGVPSHWMIVGSKDGEYFEVKEQTMNESNDKQYWDGYDNGVISTYEAVCDEIKRIRESNEQGDSLSILEDFVLEQKSVFELAFKRKEQENE